MNSRGFTLIEIMIAVGIIGVLTAIAWPNYVDYMNKSRRSDATTALMSLQLAQEKLRGNCRFYAGTLAGANNCDATAAATTVNFPANTDEGWYTITLAGASGTGYTATATADAGDRQIGDTNCRTLSLRIAPDSPNGTRGSTDANGNDTTGQCW